MKILIQVRVGTSIRGPKGIEGESEYHDKYVEAKGDRADFVAVNDLLTPYGDLAGEAKRLGEVK